MNDPTAGTTVWSKFLSNVTVYRLPPSQAPAIGIGGSSDSGAETTKGQREPSVHLDEADLHEHPLPHNTRKRRRNRGRRGRGHHRPARGPICGTKRPPCPPPRSEQQS